MDVQEASAMSSSQNQLVQRRLWIFRDHFSTEEVSAWISLRQDRVVVVAAVAVAAVVALVVVAEAVASVAVAVAASVVAVAVVVAAVALVVDVAAVAAEEDLLLVSSPLIKDPFRPMLVQR